jgi:hypothetical protein
MSAYKSPSQIKQLLHRLKMDEIYWQGLQQYTTNPAIRSMATKNLATIRLSRDELQQAAKRPPNLTANGVPGFIHRTGTLDRSFGRDRNMSEVMKAHEGDEYSPTSSDPD